ncbi:MAG TPA: c-type cytochrome [Usitatibacter sp.]|nr:c-type cytochrome [Usitatibacter sp.]
MRKVIRRAAIALVIVAIAAGGAFAFALWQAERKLERRLEVRVVPVPYTNDRKALAQGKYLFETRGCAECHGADGRGVVFVDSPGGLHVKSPNITTGAGGVVSDYNEGDWVRAIRHGIAPSGRALVAMPSDDYNRMSDADFAALVAYVRALPPVRGEPADIRMPFFVKALYGIGVVKDAAEKIDHRRPPAPGVPAAATAEHGAYVALMCAGCHRASFEGGPIPGAPPDWPPAANLTRGEAMARYDTLDKFVAMMRTGKRPDGTSVSRVMPFMSLRNMNDTDLQAMYLYLRSLPAR